MRFSHAFFLTFMTREVMLAFGFLNSIILARYLGPEGIGSYALIVTTAHFLAQVLCLGLNQANNYFAAKEPDRAGFLFTQSVLPVLLLVGPLIGCAVWWPAAGDLLFGRLNSDLRLGAMIGTGILVLQVNLGSILFGLQRYKRYGLVNALPNVGTALTNVVVVIVLKRSVEWAIGAWLAWNLLAVLVSAGLLSALAKPRWKIDRTFLWECIRIGAKGLLTSFLGYLALRGILAILNHYHGPAVVGYYSVAVPVSELLLHAPGVLGAMLFTKTSARQYSGGEVARILRMHLALGALGCIALGLLSWTLFPIVFGTRFSQSVVPFQILLFGNYFMGLWILTSGYLSGRYGYPPTVVLLTGLMAALTLGFGFWWIPGSGATGGAEAWSVATAIASLAMLGVFLKDTRGEVRGADLVPRLSDLSALWNGLLGRTRTGSGTSNP
jgi:O-antigen/teichoic acid export membrane protein